MISLEKLQKNNTSYYTDQKKDYVFNVTKERYLKTKSEIKKIRQSYPETSTIITIIPEDKPFIYRAVRNNQLDTVERIDKQVIIKKSKKFRKKNTVNHKNTPLQAYILINDISNHSKKNKRVHKVHSHKINIHNKKKNNHINDNKKNHFNYKNIKNHENLKKYSSDAKFNEFSKRAEKYQFAENKWNLPLVFNEFRKNKKINHTRNLENFINMLEQKIILSFKIDKLKNKIKNNSARQDKKSNFLTSISLSCCNLLNKIINSNDEKNNKKVYPILNLLKSSLIPINILQEIKNSFDTIYQEDKKNKLNSLNQVNSVKNVRIHSKKHKKIDLRREFIKNINKYIKKYNSQKNKLHKKMFWKNLDSINFNPEFFDFKKMYKQAFTTLQKTNKLSDKFLNNFHNSYYQINGKDLTSESISAFAKEFRKTVKDPELQQLISLYANEDVLNPAYLQLLKNNRSLLKYTPTTPNFHYKIKIVDPNTIEIVALNTGLLEENPDGVDKNDSNTKIFCIKSILKVSKKDTPKFNYSYTIN